MKKSSEPKVVPHLTDDQTRDESTFARAWKEVDKGVDEQYLSWILRYHTMADHTPRKPYEQKQRDAMEAMWLWMHMGLDPTPKSDAEFIVERVNDIEALAKWFAGHVRAYCWSVLRGVAEKKRREAKKR